jgi:hypothetical protein
MIRIGGSDLKVLPMDGKQLVSPLDSADLFVVDHHSLTAQLLAQTPIAIARKLSLDPLDMSSQFRIAMGLPLNVGLGMVVIAA